MLTNFRQRHLQAVADTAASRKVDNTRHKCFISYHVDDSDEVENFLGEFGTEFIAKTIGVTDEDDFINSEDTDYIMDRIRTKYLGDSSVTIVLIGKCTWARRYVDWEVYSSLRDSTHSKVNGLLAIQLPNRKGLDTTLQARIADNVKRENGADVGYARYYEYPGNKSILRNWISDAFNARTERVDLLNNTQQRRLSSAPCS